MTSSDEASRTTLRSWCEEGSMLRVQFTAGPLEFSGRGKVDSVDKDGFDVGWKFAAAPGDPVWLLSVSLDGAEISSMVAEDVSFKLIVTVKLGPSTLKLTGPDLSIRPVGAG